MEYKKYFTMSFDDGPQQDKRLIGLLNKYGLKATFNLNSGLMGQRKHALRMGDFGFAAVRDKDKFPASLFKGAPCDSIPADEVAQVYEGFEVASHGKQHKMLKYLGGDALNAEILPDIEALSALVKKDVTGFAYPFGMYNAAAVQCLKGAGIRYARTVKSTRGFAFPANPLLFNPTCACFDPQAFAVINAFAQAKPLQGDLLCCLWGHAYEFDFGTQRNSWQRIEQIMQAVAGREDIVFCTNHEAFALHASRKESIE